LGINEKKNWHKNDFFAPAYRGDCRGERFLFFGRSRRSQKEKNEIQSDQMAEHA